MLAGHGFLLAKWISVRVSTRLRANLSHARLPATLGRRLFARNQQVFDALGCWTIGLAPVGIPRAERYLQSCARELVNFGRALSPEYSMRCPCTKSNLSVSCECESLVEVGHGGEYGGQARPQGATAKEVVAHKRRVETLEASLLPPGCEQPMRRSHWLGN